MLQSTKINFILPFRARRPAGGFRIMYEYANRLASKGYKVHLTYPISTPFMQYRLPKPVRKIVSMIEGFGGNYWFSFHPSITMEYVCEVKEQYIADADIVIATWWTTAMEMGKLSEKKGRKINLIQGYENWEGHEDMLHKTYNMPNTTNVVVASYLKTRVDEYSNSPTLLIHNSIDKSVFNISTSIEKRIPTTVAMTYSVQEIKGSEYGIKALELVYKQYPQLKVELFGVAPSPDNLPPWITYYRNPDNLPELYNRNALFLSNSFTEGFPLTPAEALFCGCALICTHIDGHKEFAEDEKTALLVEVKNPSQMATKICELIENNEKRITLAKQGNAHIQQFEWKKAITKMEELIQELCANG